MATKDISVQCSLLPAPPLCFGQKLEPEVDTFSDLDTDATTEEVDDSDTEYMNDTAVIEG